MKFRVHHPRTDDVRSDQRAARRGPMGRRERGATLVEYALLVAVLAVPTVGGIEYIRSGAERKVDSTAEGISTHTLPTVTTAPDGGGGGGATTSSSTPASTAPTTAAPTTAAPTTAAPTTTAPPVSVTSSWSTPTTSRTNSNTRWTASTRVTIKNAQNASVANATVVIKVEYRTARSGSWITDQTITMTTNSSGQATATPSKSYSISSGSTPPKARDFRFTVVSVTAPSPGVTGGTGTTVSVNNPWD
ncbi:MAG: Flp family type IVb pilin [Microthrixaceae bacterium]